MSFHKTLHRPPSPSALTRRGYIRRPTPRKNFTFIRRKHLAYRTYSSQRCLTACPSIGQLCQIMQFIRIRLYQNDNIIVSSYTILSRSDVDLPFFFPPVGLFFSVFACHIPIIHVPTFDLATAPPILL